MCSTFQETKSESNIARKPDFGWPFDYFTFVGEPTSTSTAKYLS